MFSQGDYGSAKVLDITKTYVQEKAPKGFGIGQEIKKDNKSAVSFEKEHNSAWFKFVAPTDGTLVFTIEQMSKDDDYDFMLFIFVGEKMVLQRSNVARSDGNGATGLSFTATQETVGRGVNSNLSKSIETKENQEYILVVDNVYGSSAGFVIAFDFRTKIELMGQIFNEMNKPVPNAEITLNTVAGEEISKVYSDQNGNYKLTDYVVSNGQYVMLVTAEGKFFHSDLITANNKEGFKDIKVVLPELKKGNKYPVGNIQFYGDKAQTLPSAEVSLFNLYKLMDKNKNMVIQVEGHVNTPGYPELSMKRSLSIARAKAVYDYLISKGISADRLKYDGFGGKYMIYVNPKNDWEMEQNRRVEINVLEY